MNWTAWPEAAVPVPGHAWAKPMKVVEDAFRKGQGYIEYAY